MTYKMFRSASQETLRLWRKPRITKSLALALNPEP